MRKRNLAGWALALILPLIGAGSCDGSRGGTPQQPPAADTRARCPDIEFRAANERCLILQTFVESRLGPYDVDIMIEGGVGAYPPHVPVAAGGWKHSLVYRTGVKMTITVTLRYEGGPSKDGFCAITDAQQYTRDNVKSIRAQGGSPYQAVCKLITSQ